MNSNPYGKHDDILRRAEPGCRCIRTITSDLALTIWARSAIAHNKLLNYKYDNILRRAEPGRRCIRTITSDLARTIWARSAIAHNKLLNYKYDNILRL